MSTRSLAATAAVLALLASPALAADVYGRGSVKDDPESFEAPAMVNWSGIYIGVHGGVGNDTHNLELSTNHDEGDNETLFGLDGLASNGFVGGARLGADIARGRYVFGLFGSYNLTNQETELSFGSDGSITAEKQDEWDLMARLGYIVAPRTMVYIQGGYTETSYELNSSEDGNLGEKDYGGIRVGLGGEYALGNGFFAGLEYNHTFYDTETLAEDCLKLTDELDSDTVMITLKAKLGGIERLY